MMPNNGSLADSRAISEKEEIARAALRSLAESPTATQVNRSLPSKPSNTDRIATGSASRSLSMTSEPRSAAGSFFDNQHITSSPLSSPRLLPGAASGSRPFQPLAGDFDFTSSTVHAQDLAIRRVSSLFRISTEAVRSILHDVSPLRAATMPLAPLTSSQAHDSGFARRVLETYTYELEGLCNTTAGTARDAPRGASRSMGDIFERAPQPWQEAARLQRSNDLPHNAASHIPSHQVNVCPGPALGTESNRHTDMTAAPSPRPPSPSPFAFDPHRRPSHPVSQPMYPPEPMKGYARHSLDHGSWRYPSTSDVPAYAASHAHHSLYPRKGRSIDDFLHHQSRPDPSPARHQDLSTASRIDKVDLIPSSYHNAKRDHQPYQSRNAAATSAPIEPSMRSPGPKDASRTAYLQRRSPRPSGATRSPSIAPSLASASRYTLSPSPVIDPSGSSHDGKQHSRARGGSEESTGEIARVRVAGMRIEDKPNPAPFVGQLRSVRSSSAISSTSATSEVSHSEIMQRLQHRVKSRLAAKSRGENPDLIGTKKSSKASRVSTPSKRMSSAQSTQAQTPSAVHRNAESNIGSDSNKVRKLSKASTSAPSASPRRTETPTSIAAAILSPTDSPTPAETARNVTATQTSQSAEGATVTTASGQALPSDLPGAGQMKASSATQQQSSMAGIDSLLQAAAASDPTESGHAIA